MCPAVAFTLVDTPQEPVRLAEIVMRGPSWAGDAQARYLVPQLIAALPAQPINDPRPTHFTPSRSSEKCGASGFGVPSRPLNRPPHRHSSCKLSQNSPMGR